MVMNRQVIPCSTGAIPQLNLLHERPRLPCRGPRGSFHNAVALASSGTALGTRSARLDTVFHEHY
jgi:hypothetical protein